MVIGLPDDDLGNRAHAVVHTGSPVSDADLENHVREKLAPHKIPPSSERSAATPRDDADKVRRSALRAARR
ncbi:hypothetical protein KGS77_34100 [Streptomyces sp. MST-110588]|nr:hypothetical protein KGS77_34100 [Streptomyces sp. MST-110588]